MGSAWDLIQPLMYLFYTRNIWLHEDPEFSFNFVFAQWLMSYENTKRNPKNINHSSSLLETIHTYLLRGKNLGPVHAYEPS